MTQPVGVGHRRSLVVERDRRGAAAAEIEMDGHVFPQKELASLGVVLFEPTLDRDRLQMVNRLGHGPVDGVILAVELQGSVELPRHQRAPWTWPS